MEILSNGHNLFQPNGGQEKSENYVYSDPEIN
jgi:hypothetical protein